MRIGFIALSGVRACDEELMRLGMTLPGFVERSKTIASLPSLGLLTLAGMTPDQHEVTYLEVDQLDDVERWPEFDLVALSTFTAQARDAYHIADHYRASGTPVVIGGLHVTALPDEAATHADAVVIGEGELCWPEILRDAEAGTLQPRYRSQPREFDLAEAPMLGLDGQTSDIFDRIDDFTERLELYDVQITLQTPFPGTPLYETLRREGRLFEPDAWHRCTLFDLTYEPTPMGRDELVEGFRDLARRLYSESFTAWRRENFRRKYMRPIEPRNPPFRRGSIRG